jgi:predicted metal-dependent peptidase
MTEQETKEYQKFIDYYQFKDIVLSLLLRSETFLPFGLETLKYQTIFTEHVPSGAPAATDFQRIFINPEDEFFKNPKVDHNSIITFTFLHEISHNIFVHNIRGEGKDIHLWGYATDYFINLFLYHIEKENLQWEQQSNLIIMKIEDYKDQILFSEKFNNMIEEEIYDKLQKDGNFKKKESQQSYKDFLDNIGLPFEGISPDSKIKVIETELTFEGKTDKKVFVEFPKPENSEQEESNNQFDTRLAKTMFESRILSRGFNNQSFEKFIKRIFNVKINWQTILRDSILIELQKKSDISYSSPRLIWMANPNLPYLPNIQDEEIMGTAVIAIDESGSISHEDISKAVNIIEQSSSYYKDLIILKHDTKISWEKKFEESLSENDINELLIRRTSGGTSHKEIFQRIIELINQGIFISIVICITDLYSDIEETQKLLSYKTPRIYIRSNKEYNTEKIIGKIIDIK